MFRALFANHAYVQVRPNQFRIHHLESGRDVRIDASTPFTTQRMLVGDFTVAQHALKRALREVTKGRLIALGPRVLIQPMEMIEGGLCQVEERVLRELAIGAGASKVVVWVGPALNDIEVKQKLRGR